MDEDNLDRLSERRRTEAIMAQLNDIRISFRWADVKGKDRFYLGIRYNLPMRLLGTQASTHKALHHLNHCLTQELGFQLPMPFKEGSYRISANTLLFHRDSGEQRVFRQSFNPQMKEYNVVSDFTALVPQAQMATHIYSLAKNEEVLHETINVDIDRDSDWSLDLVLSLVVVAQVIVRRDQLRRIGLSHRRQKTMVVPWHGGAPIETDPIGFMDQ